MTELIRKYGLFGSTAEFMLSDVEETVASPILDEAYSLGLKLQKIFNIYDKDSELSKLNKKRKLKVSPELIKVLKLAVEYSRLSDGEYDVAQGKQFLERKKGHPVIKPSCSYRDIRIDGSQITLINPDVLIDLGSIAKGFIADEVARFLAESGLESGYVDARGDLKFFGKEQEVGIQHPRENRLFCQLKVKDCGVATSGDYKQFQKSFDESHILNTKEIISATVVADELMTADLFASLVMVFDIQKRDALLEKNPGIKAMTIDKQLIVKYYNGFEELITK